MVGDDSLWNKDEWISRVSHEAELTILRNQVAQWRSLYETAQRMVEMQNNQAARELALSHAAGQEAEQLACEACGYVGSNFGTIHYQAGDADAECPECGAVECDEPRSILRRLIRERDAAQATTNPAEIGRKSVGGEAVAWIISDGSAVSVATKERDADVWRNQPGYTVRPLVYGDTPAQPPASAEVGSFVSCTCQEPRQKELCLNKHRCVRAYPLAASSGRKGDEMP